VEPGRQWATWLHQVLETYEVPAELVGQTNQLGETIPSRIYPVFRDEEDLPADANLATSVRSALERSKTLIVLCSPNVVESTYVSEEIAYFKQMGRDERILAVMIEGGPNASWDAGKQKAGFSPFQECFPLPLIHPVSPDGDLIVTETAEPIAADFRVQPGSRQGWTAPEAYREELVAGGGSGPTVGDRPPESQGRAAHALREDRLRGHLRRLPRDRPPLQGSSRNLRDRAVDGLE